MKYLILTIAAIMAIFMATSCSDKTPATDVVVAPAPAVAVAVPAVTPAAPAVAPVVVVAKPAAKVAPKAAKHAKPKSAEQAAYAKAYANAALANRLLGRNAYVTGPNKPKAG